MLGDNEVLGDKDGLILELGLYEGEIELLGEMLVEGEYEGLTEEDPTPAVLSSTSTLH